MAKKQRPTISLDEETLACVGAPCGLRCTSPMVLVHGEKDWACRFVQLVWVSPEFKGLSSHTWNRMYHPQVRLSNIIQRWRVAAKILCRAVVAISFQELKVWVQRTTDLEKRICQRILHNWKNGSRNAKIKVVVPAMTLVPTPFACLRACPRECMGPYVHSNQGLPMMMRSGDL